MQKIFLFIVGIFLIVSLVNCTSLNRKLETPRNIANTEQLQYTHPEFANPDIRSEGNWVTIKAGTFQMGSPLSEKNRDRSEEDLHDVTITKDFSIQKTVVTQGQFYRVKGYNTAQHSYNCGNEFVEFNDDRLCVNYPVDNVSWNDTKDFIEKLNASDSKYVYRLPTEAEWEYSARGGTQTAYWFGNDTDKLSDYVWFRENSRGKRHPVGSKPANQYGLYDAHGSIWQWVQDWYTWNLGTSHKIDPTGPTNGPTRVLRGGANNNYSYEVRAASRSASAPNMRYNESGFRLVRTPK